MRKMIVLSCLLLAGCIPAMAGPEIEPEIRHDGRETYAGVRVTWRFGGPAPERATAPARMVYVEQYRWSTKGTLLADGAAPGAIDDTGGRVVEVKEVPVERNFWGRSADHFRENAGKYVAGSVVSAAVAGIYAIGDNNGWWGGSKGGKDAPPQPTYNAPDRSQAVTVVSGNQSPVTVNITIQEMAAAE